LRCSDTDVIVCAVVRFRSLRSQLSCCSAISQTSPYSDSRPWGGHCSRISSWLKVLKLLLLSHTFSD